MVAILPSKDKSKSAGHFVGYRTLSLLCLRGDWPQLVFEAASHFGLFVAGMLGGGGFDEGDPGLFGGAGIVAHSFGNDEDFAGLQGERAAVGFATADGEGAFEDEEELIFVFMGMPGELALNFGDFEVLIVNLGEDARAPEFGERGADVLERDGGVHV
jgi:hypothetical protein